MADEESVVFSKGKAWIDRKHGIVRVAFLPRTEQTLADAREEMEAIMRASEGVRYPLLVDMANVKSTSREARAFYASAEAAAAWRAVALLSRSTVTTMIANVFFAAFGGGEVPTKLFTSESEAIAWLEGFRA